MKKLILPALLIGLVSMSCAKKETATDSTPETTMEQVVTENTENEVTFEGTTPCADCPGIETKLELNWKDMTFKLDTSYLEKPDGKFSSKGSFEADENKEFVTIKGEGGTSQVYYIANDAAYLVEKVGDKTTKEEYKLSKK